MTLASTEKKSNLLLHIVGCLAFLLLPFLMAPEFPHMGRTLHNPLGLRDVVTHALLLVFFYLHYYTLIPQFFFKGKYVLYGLAVLAGLALTVVLPAIIPALMHHGPPPPPPHDFHVGPPHPPIHPFPGPPPHHGLLQRLLFNHNLYFFLLVFAFSLMLRINSRWKTARQEKTQTELLFLKAQINPHFLFNTLNSVYSLCIEEKATQSASAVLKVSGMMRYVLIDSRQDFVDIEKEIDYVKSFIELQRLRFGNTVKIDFVLNGSFTGKKIAPLLLISFIENAFKYGVNPEADSTIGIELTMHENELVMKVRNKKVAPTGNDQKMGIGIPTTLKRMELLYPRRHQIRISDQNDLYEVLLSLTLS